MQERRNSCIMAPSEGAAHGPVKGYWRHPGFVLQGTFQAVGFKPGVLSSSLCAQKCDDEALLPTSCDAFSYNPDDRLCLLMVCSLLWKGCCCCCCCCWKGCCVIQLCMYKFQPNGGRFEAASVEFAIPARENAILSQMPRVRSHKHTHNTNTERKSGAGLRPTRGIMQRRRNGNLRSRHGCDVLRG